MAAEKTDGLVIRVTDFSETSRVVTFFTRDFGKISALAKGGRRLKGPFESALDLLALCQIVFLRKSSSSLDQLTEARLVRPFRPVGRDVTSFYGGYYVAELLQGLTEDYDPHPRLYEAAEETLDRLCRQDEPRQAILRFELILLQELGLLPPLDSCIQCGAAVETKGNDVFWLASGGLLCKECHRKRPKGFRLSLGTLAVIRRLLDDQRRIRQRLRVTDPQMRQMQQALAPTLAHALGRRPRTLRYLEF